MAKPDPNKKLLAEPAGTIAWTPEMEQQVTAWGFQFARSAAGQIAETHDFARNRDACEALFGQYHDYSGAQLSLLRWHGLAALEWILGSIEKRLGRKGTFPPRYLMQIEDARISAFLAGHLSLPGARATLTTLAERWPLLVARQLLQQQPTRVQAAACLLYELLARFPTLPALLEAHATADERAMLERLTRFEPVQDASVEMLPALLREPPWRMRKGNLTLPTLALTPIREPARIHFPSEGFAHPSAEESREKFLEDIRWRRGSERYRDLVHEPEIAAVALGVRRDVLGKLASDGPWEASDFGEFEYTTIPDALALLPPGLISAAFEHLPLRAFHKHYGGAASYWNLLQRYPEAALRSLLHDGAINLSVGWGQAPILASIDWDEAALLFAHSHLRNRWKRTATRAWLTRYPESAARGLIPHAFGSDAAARTSAQHALRQMRDWGASAAIRGQAVRYGADASAAVDALLAIRAVDLLPAKLPALPKDLFLPMLPRLMLTGEPGRAVPLAAVPDVLMCVLLSRIDMPYAGLLELQRELTPDSFAAFARALFKWWLDKDGPVKERWALEIQGLLGDNQTVAVLNRALLAWRQALNRVRAYDALNLIAQIGSDLALMRLTAWAEHPRYNDLATRARKLLADVAEARGLSLEELADRTVPDLGLDANGTLQLDFGPRQFEVRLDNRLQPQLLDGSGRPLKSLPSANSKDDLALAKLAKAQFADFRKQAKTIASVQIKRFELAMVGRRRWSLSDARTLIFDHPVLRILAGTLVWGVYREECLSDAFCLSDDYSLSDRHDQPLQFGTDAQVGVLHPLDADAALLADFAQRFTDYEVLQPFMQLGREVFRLEPGLATAHTLPQWHGRQLGGGSVLGLEQRGWNRRVGDGGYVNHFAKPLSGGREVTLYLSPGWHVAGGNPNEEPHEVNMVGLSHGHQWSQLTALEFSELQRDLSLIAWHQH